jgi:hypothetical protein
MTFDAQKEAGEAYRLRIVKDCERIAKILHTASDYLLPAEPYSALLAVHLRELGFKTERSLESNAWGHDSFLVTK